eukprot:m.74131 g.74131  ORF g.74131 m.74131 type:complete len:361 (-) comp17077_c0_seq2:35-1117(-)
MELRLTFALLVGVCGSTARVSFELFERSVLPKWLDSHALENAATHGNYSFFPAAIQPSTSAYGSADMAHLLYFTGQLESLPASTMTNWAVHINSFQNSSGYFSTPDGGLCGFQPWHATAYMSSALALLNATTRFPNAYYRALAAQNATVWHSVFDPLLLPHSPAGCDSIHACAHKITSIPATLVLRNATAAHEFVAWWFQWVENNLNVSSGTLCPADQAKALGNGVCLGAGAAIHFVYDALDRAPWPLRAKVQEFALALQQSNGLWSGSSLANWLNLDGVMQATHDVSATPHPDLAQQACARFLPAAARILNSWPLTEAEFAPKGTHGLPGAVAAVAQCAQVFPQLVQTQRSWRCCGPFP